MRLRDNPALHEALRHGAVTPVFVLDPAVLQSRYHRRAEKRRDFLLAGLRALDAELKRRDSRLIVREGDPDRELQTLMQEAGADRIVAAEDFSPYARRRDAAIAEQAELHLTPGIAVRHPSEVVKSDGEPFRVFTPYSRAWLGLPLPDNSSLLRAPETLPAVDAAISSVPIPELSSSSAFPAGEDEAQRRLEAFAAGPNAPIYDYAGARNSLAEAGTSALSPYLRFGMVSAREAVVRALAAQAAATTTEDRRGAAAWLNELIWRDFYLAVLYHFPQVMTEEFDPTLRGIAWRNAPADVDAWQQGRTGYPIIDAAMRQLAATGGMHNRARMLVASFLVKNLLCDWRIGEQWFMDHLLDGDPAANNGGWQWTAGVGTDAAPYFRVFNPVLQAKKFDAGGSYVRRWLPELADVPERYLHEPWLLPAARGDIDYPAPIVDLQESRQRALAAYQVMKQKRR